jgi:hypothetical protein
MLGYRKGKEIKPYTAQEIGALVGLYARSGYLAFINKMLRLHVMHKIQDTSNEWQYYINPAYFMANGARLTLSLFLLFKDDLMPILPEWVMGEFLTMAHEKDVKLSVLNEAEYELRRICQH